MQQIDGPGLPAGGAVYDRVRDGQEEIVSDLIATLTYEDGSENALASATRVYDDHRDLLESIENEESGTPETISMYTYAYDDAGRRTSVVYTGSAFSQNHLFLWGYNSRGELTTADRHQGTNPGSPGTQYGTNGAFDYTYDPIGNRLTSNVDDSQTPTHYCANEVNQYDATAAAAGCATPAESFSYDDDGNLTADGTMTYVWNGENRLVEAFPTTPAAGDVKVRFAYDYMGRRVRKEVIAWDDGAGDWAATPTTDLKFVYDGWNLVQVLDGTTTGNPVTWQYTWGSDLSGMLGGAGGIGGLLATVETQGTSSTADDDAYWYFYDGNGNVGQLLNADDQTLAVHYEYDPYGNIIVASDVDTSDYVNVNPFRFSTKWFDVETELCSYTYRYYAPRLGRWLNRDLIQEEGGTHLYAHSRNAPLNFVDPHGLATHVFRDTITILMSRDDYEYWRWKLPVTCERGMLNVGALTWERVNDGLGRRIVDGLTRNQSAIIYNMRVHTHFQCTVNTTYLEPRCPNHEPGDAYASMQVVCESWKYIDHGVSIGIGPISIGSLISLDIYRDVIDPEEKAYIMSVECCCGKMSIGEVRPTTNRLPDDGKWFPGD